MEAKFGLTLSKMFFEKYPKKVWGIDTDKMLADWAPQRIKLREKNQPFYTKSFVAVGKKGTGCFYDRIIEILKKEINFKLIFEHKLTGIERTKNYIKKLIFNNKEIIEINDSDHVFSTIPASNLSRLFNLNLDLNYRGVQSEYFFFENKRILPQNYNWVYCSDINVAFNRITEPSTMTKDVCPNGYTFVCVETTFPGGEIDQLKNNSGFLSWIKNRSNFDSSGIIPQLYTKNIENYVYPIQDKNFRSALTRYNSLISSYKNLNVLGTGGEFHYSDMQIIFRKSKNMINSILSKKRESLNAIPLIKNINFNENQNIDINLEFEKQNQKISYLEKISRVKIPLIAEIGINHNGNLELAKYMMAECKRVGAHFAKFQYYKTDSRVEKNSKTEYLHETADGSEMSLNDVFERSQLNLQQCRELIKYGDEISLPVFFTVFDIPSAIELNNLNQKIIKVASMDCNNIELHQALNKLNFETIIISTGMSNINEVLRTLSIYKNNNKEILLMSCRSSYPVNFKDIDLGEINFLKEKTGLHVGYSDHTEGIMASLLAVASGATFIERHFTTNKSLPGPDNRMSLDTEEMSELSNNLQITFNSIYRKRKTIHPCEQVTFQMQKKSLRFKKDFKKNQIIHTDDLASIAPPEGYCEFQSKISIGKLRLLKDVKKGTPVDEKNVEVIN